MVLLPRNEVMVNMFTWLTILPPRFEVFSTTSAWAMPWPSLPRPPPSLYPYLAISLAANPSPLPAAMPADGSGAALAAGGGDSELAVREGGGAMAAPPPSPFLAPPLSSSSASSSSPGRALNPEGLV